LAADAISVFSDLTNNSGEVGFPGGSEEPPATMDLPLPENLSVLFVDDDNVVRKLRRLLHHGPFLKLQAGKQLFNDLRWKPST